MVDPRIKAAAEAMMLRSQAGSLLPIPWEVLAQVAIDAADAVTKRKADPKEYFGRYEIELPLRIGQGWDILSAVEDAEDIVEGTAALSTALIREAKLIERLPDEPGDYFDGEGA